MAARGHLTALPSPADERRAWDRRATALELPERIGETRVDWEPWALPLVISHIPRECVDCGANDGARAVGIVTYRRASGRPRPIRRFFAYGCLACGVIDVYDWYHRPLSTKVDFGEAWTNRPAAPKSAARVELDGQLELFSEFAEATHE